MKYYLKKYWKIFSLMLLLHIGYTILWMLTPLLRIRELDAILDRDMKQFLFILGVLVAVMAFGFIFRQCSQQMLIVINQKITNCMRDDISRKLLRKDYQEYHTKQVGDYISLYTNDVDQTNLRGFSLIVDLVAAFVQTVGGVIILFSFHWSLAVISVLCALIMLMIPKLFDKKLNQRAEAFSEAHEVFVSRLKDLLSGFEVFKSFLVPKRFSCFVEEASEEREKSYRRLNSFNYGTSFIILMANLFFLSALTLMVGVLSILAYIPITTMAGAESIVSSVFNGIAIMSSTRITLMSGKPFFDKITPTQEDMQAEKENQGSLTKIEEGIVMDQVSYSYEEKQVLNQISASFEKGKKYALVGASGSGKTTMLKILLKQLTDYEGKLLIDGIDARDYSQNAIYQQLAYIEQDVFLFNDTILENITLGHSFTKEQIDKAIRDSALTSDMEKIPGGLSYVVGENGRNLSGGQKQRVAIARALIHDKSYLLIDEGTSALDKENAALVEEQLVNNPRITVILITHHLNPEKRGQFDAIYNLDQMQRECAAV